MASVIRPHYFPASFRSASVSTVGSEEDLFESGFTRQTSALPWRNNSTRVSVDVAAEFKIRIKNTFVHVDEDVDNTVCIGGKIARSRSFSDMDSLDPFRPIISKGSLDHGAGFCKPGVWFGRSGGGYNGTECQHRGRAGLQCDNECSTSFRSASVSTTTSEQDTLESGSTGQSSPLSLRGSPTHVSVNLAADRKIRIKNTFIDVEDEEECVGGKIVRSKSLPTMAFSEISGQRSVATVVEKATESWPLLDPLRPIISKGSVDHGTGSCKPCVWFWRSEGCSNGTECQHCHMCPKDEISRRRKSRRLAKRNQRRFE